MSAAIIDYGIGAIHFWLKTPKKYKYYFSDSGYTPYGKLSDQELYNRLTQVIDFLVEKQVQHIFIACNAASTQIDHLKKKYPNTRFTGMFELIKRTLSSCPNQSSILLIGGEITIKNGTIEKTMTKLGHKVYPVATQILSALVEANDLSNLKTHYDQLFKNILKNEITGLYIGCTHYTELTKSLIEDFNGVSIYDPVNVSINLPDKDHETIFYTTGTLSHPKIKSSTKVELA